MVGGKQYEALKERTLQQLRSERKQVGEPVYLPLVERNLLEFRKRGLKGKTGGTADFIRPVLIDE